MIELLTVSDLASAAGVNESTVRRDMRTGVLVPDARTRSGLSLFGPETFLAYARARGAQEK
jgi:hypothetical protein